MSISYLKFGFAIAVALFLWIWGYTFGNPYAYLVSIGVFIAGIIIRKLDKIEHLLKELKSDSQNKENK